MVMGIVIGTLIYAANNVKKEYECTVCHNKRIMKGFVPYL